VIIGSGAQIIGPIVVGERARVGANAVVTEDVPGGATMIGLKARSTLVPAEEWIKEFIPYGTPCDDPPCDDEGRPRRDCIEKLESEVATLRDELAQMKAMLAEREAPVAASRTRKSGTKD
jgi:serine O-acetyltransferase